MAMQAGTECGNDNWLLSTTKATATTLWDQRLTRKMAHGHGNAILIRDSMMTSTSNPQATAILEKQQVHIGNVCHVMLVNCFQKNGGKYRGNQ